LTNIRNIDNKITSKNITIENFHNLSFQGKTVVFTNGCFDVFHNGHIYLLKEAKKLGDVLIVGLNSDESIKANKGIERPINKLQYRINVLISLIFVDYIIVFNETTPLELIKNIKPDILVKGDDYDINNVVGKDYAKSVVFIKKIPEISSTRIISQASGGCINNK